MSEPKTPEPKVPDRATRFLRLMEEGRQFTEELLRENERLRLQVGSLRAEKAELEARAAQADGEQLQEKLRTAEQETRALRAAVQELRRQFDSVEAENREFAERHVTIERQYSDLIQLYVASYELHSTLEFEKVLELLKGIIINVIGSEAFGVYLVNEEATQLVLMAHEGLEDRPVRVPIDEGPLGQALLQDRITVLDTAAPRSADQPLAVVPLKAGEAVIGVIAVYQLLSHKEGFASLDHEMFELLGSHAGTALCASSIYAVSERKRTTLENLIGMLTRS